MVWIGSRVSPTKVPSLGLSGAGIGRWYRPLRGRANPEVLGSVQLCLWKGLGLS
jgi:hypothetical protein